MFEASLGYIVRPYIMMMMMMMMTTYSKVSKDYMRKAVK